MLDSVWSRNGIRIRLTNGRWSHIVEEHSELAGLRAEVLETLAQPSKVVAGHGCELLALAEQRPGMWLVVIYRETVRDGFIITAFLSTKRASFDRRRQVWP